MKNFEMFEIEKNIRNNRKILSIKENIEEPEDSNNNLREYDNFWEFLLPSIREITTKFNNKNYTGKSYMITPTSVSGCGTGLSIINNSVSTFLTIYSEEKSINTFIFDKLSEYKVEIEKEIGNKLVWQNRDDRRGASIGIIENINAKDKKNWIEASNFFLKYFPIFEKVFTKYLEKIKPEIEELNNSEDVVDTSSGNMTIPSAAALILKNNDNRPMSSQEIYNEIKSKNLFKFITTTPVASIGTLMRALSINTKQKTKRDIKKCLFEIVSLRPQKFVLLNPEEIKSTTSNDEVYRFRRFRSAQSDSENKIDDVFLKNPFGGYDKDRGDTKGTSAICVLGESGAGKSYTIENILEEEEHEYQFIIPTSSTTGLTSQYSPRKKEYVPSRLSKMIMEAYENPNKLYTAVFDECHKSNTIEMINDELLQAISKKRNKYRYISLDEDTMEQVFGDTDVKIERGNLKIPDNFGFIFISSNARVIGGNPDFFNRVDLIELKSWEEEKITTLDQLLSKRVEDKEDKKELIDKMKSR